MPKTRVEIAGEALARLRALPDAALQQLSIRILTANALADLGL